MISSLTRVKDQLPLYVEYNQIKLVIARLVSLHGQETNDKQELVLSGAELHQQVSFSDVSTQHSFTVVWNFERTFFLLLVS